MAKVKVTKHDHVAQTIALEADDPVVTSALMPCDRQHSDDAQDEMREHGVHENNQTC
jgi:hypothetical protein